MRNGLYRIEFATDKGAGAGIVVLQNGKLWGGDPLFYYTGYYNIDGEHLAATLVTQRHRAAAGVPALLGVDTANLRLSGSFRDGEATLSGAAVEVPGMALRATLVRLAD